MAAKKKKVAAKKSPAKKGSDRSSAKGRGVRDNANVPTHVAGGVSSPDRAAQYGGGPR